MRKLAVFLVFVAFLALPTAVFAADEPAPLPVLTPIQEVLEWSEDDWGRWPRDIRFGLEDPEGNIIVPPIFRQVETVWVNGREMFFGPYIVVQFCFDSENWGDRRWGVVNRYGEYVVWPVFTQMNPIAGTDLLRVQYDGAWGIIDRRGNIILPIIYRQIGEFTDGTAPIQYEREWGIVDISGNIIIPFEYQAATGFVNGFAAVRHDNGWGFIDRDNNIVVSPIYDAVSPFNGYGLARVRLDGKYGFVDYLNRVHIPLIYDALDEDFLYGLARAGMRTDEDSWARSYGFINIGGHVVVPLEFSWHEAEILRSLMRIPAANLPDLVEKPHWWDDNLRSTLPQRVDLQIFDIFSGITYNVRSFSNGNHADVEPATAADTEALFRAAGGASWNGRPVWVTVGDRTFAAAIHSMPHAQDTIPDNNMDGHICLHFYGSTQHVDNRAVHAYTILAAYEAFGLLSRVLR